MTTNQVDNEHAIDDSELLGQAIKLIKKRRLDHAEKILLDIVSRTPPDYTNSFEDGDTLYVRFWDKSDFVYYTERQRELGLARSMAWIVNVYPRANYYLGFIAIERKRYSDAIAWLEKGLTLQPNQPTLLIEKAKAVGFNGDLETELAIYDDILQRGEEVETSLRALALRGIGVIYIDQGKLDESESLLRRSLELEPDSAVAKNELLYIQQLRSGQEGIPATLMSAKGADLSRCKYCGRKNDSGGTAEYDGGMVFICADCIANGPKKWWQFWR